MTVYECVSPQQLNEVAGWISSLPAATFSSRCWQQASRGEPTNKFFESDGLHTFVCKDGDGQIRVVWFSVYRPFDFEGETALQGNNRCVLLPPLDVERRETRWLKETVQYVMRYSRDHNIRFTMYYIDKSWVSFFREILNVDAAPIKATRDNLVVFRVDHSKVAAVGL